MPLLLAILILVQAATAASPVKAKRSGASSMMDAMDFSSCVKESVDGTNAGKCASSEESPSCIGLKKSLEFFREKKDCMRLQGEECVEWGSRGKTQAQWMAIVAGHLGKFGTCIRRRYGSDEDNGVQAAAQDAQLIAALKKLQDGGSVLGFLEGDFLVKILEGDRLSAILQETPLAKDLKTPDFFRIKEAADNPAKLEFITSSEEQKAPLSDKDPFYEFVETHTVNAGSISISGKPQNEQATEKTETNRVPAASDLSGGSNRIRSPYSLGLDRTLFERVSGIYQKRAVEFRSIDELVKESNPPPPKDFRELLNRGGTL